MSVSGVGSAAEYAATAAQSTTKNEVTKDEFLLLFVTQLKNQDPLSPMDSTGFTSQLAQFSSLEQLTAINESTQAMVASQASQQNVYAANLIGKQVGYETEGDTYGSTVTRYGTVTGVSFESDGTYLVVDGAAKIAFGDIKVIQ